MKPLLTLLFTFLLVTASFAQTPEKSANTIDVQGYSKLIANPENYFAQILIQEEEQKVGYTTIGKMSIDTVKMNLFANLKKFGIEERDVKLMAVSSKELPMYPSSLTNISYEIKLKNKEVASKMVNEMRFTGLKGVLIKRVFTKAQRDVLADSLYNEAIKDAKRIATDLAKKTNHTVGEVKSIELRNNSVTSFGTDMDTNTEYYNLYGGNKFEMDYRDKYATCYVRIIFEMN